jgi:hypothetical protein
MDAVYGTMENNMNEIISRPRIACIGSREVPKDIQKNLMDIGRYLARKGYIISTGNADGADFFFAFGAHEINPSLVEFHLPWDSYNKVYIRSGNNVIIDGHNPDYAKIAAELHPNWKACSQGAKKLHTRNVGIVLGCTQVIAYPRMDNKNNPIGGTAMGIRIAQKYGIKVLNLAIPQHLTETMRRIQHG